MTAEVARDFAALQLWVDHVAQVVVQRFNPVEVLIELLTFPHWLIVWIIWSLSQLCVNICFLASKLFNIFIYVAVPCLSCGMQDTVP